MQITLKKGSFFSHPYGMLMDGRSYTSSDYRFGFGGYEKNKNISEGGSFYSTKERHYNGNLGRWYSLDKFSSLYPSQSPYVGLLNNPLTYIDVEGDSIELIIGRPYKDVKGVEHPYGHAVLRVFNAAEGYDITYDFGRYGKTWGIGSGEGILNVYNKPNKYIQNEMTLRSSVGYMKPTTISEDKIIISYFQSLTNQGEVYKGTGGAVPGGGGIAYKLNKEYNIFNNNCLTMSCSALDRIGKNWLGKEYEPNVAYSVMESYYKFNSLTRTEYNKGGKVKTTFTPPKVEANKKDDYIINSYEFEQPQDKMRTRTSK